MSEFEAVDGVLIRTIEKLPKNLNEKLLRIEIFRRWKEIAESLSKQILPMGIKNKTLILYASNPVVKDNMKFLANNIVEKINSTIGNGEKIIERITFGKSFEKPDESLEDIINPKFEKKINDKKISPADLKKINLTDEEISECEKKLPKIQDEQRRKELLETFLNRAKLRKWRIKNGWHKCKICDELCEPNKIICDFCKIKEREKMRKKIRRIFYDLPWTNFKVVQKQIWEEMPHMADECNLTVIESVWSSLLRETAARVSFGDKTSLDAKFLVMLFKQVDEKNLTEKLISRTLNELRFNLANQPTIKKKSQ